MLDKLPAWARHLLIVIAPALLTYIGTDVIPGLKDKAGLDGLIAVLLTMALLLLTPLTQQYGVSKTGDTPTV